MKVVIERTVMPAYLKYRYIHIPAKFRNLFPNIKKTQEMNLKTDIGIIKTTFYSVERKGPGIRSGGLVEWFEKHPKIKVGSKVIIKVTELKLKKEYSLEIVSY